ncbi:hypothetical protein [Noviherbaspirillum malthae]|jgi:hypothetical protein|uniref:hypothetical protein n=1 Tax=Noviherbaspirillum malthae TaxID=1260987 RepID=UPI00189041CF|nr:hypothetical protein [Noviherbaspirillum malthae]
MDISTDAGERMPANAAKEAIRYLDKDISAAVDRSDKGSTAREQANLEGPSHIGAIMVSAEETLGPDSLSFRAYLELYDEVEHQYEAEVAGTCVRMLAPEGAWRLTHLRVLDSGALPKGG